MSLRHLLAFPFNKKCNLDSIANLIKKKIIYVFYKTTPNHLFFLSSSLVARIHFFQGE